MSIKIWFFPELVEKLYMIMKIKILGLQNYCVLTISV